MAFKDLHLEALLTSSSSPLQQLEPCRDMAAVVHILPITKRILGLVQAAVGAVLEAVEMRRSNMGALKDVLVCLLHSPQQPGSGLVSQLCTLCLHRNALLRSICTKSPVYQVSWACAGSTFYLTVKAGAVSTPGR